MASQKLVDQAVAILNQLEDSQLEEFINLAEKKKEEGVFGQELSMDELDAAAGGNAGEAGAEWVGSLLSQDDDPNDCTQSDKRSIYGGGGFPNCAATVEDGSRCASNDACVAGAVRYTGMDCRLFNCTKAWR